MSITFADGVTDKVAFGNTGTDPTTASVYMWVNFSSLVNTRRLFDKSNSSLRNGFWRLQLPASGTGRMRILIDYATTDADATSVDNTLTTNKWYFLAGTYDGTNGPKLFTGDLTTIVSEVSYAAGPTAPVGGRVSDSGGSVTLGNETATVSASPACSVAVINWIPGTALSLGELISHQFNPSVHPNSKIFCWPGFNGTGSQIDWSGNGFNGTVTGATQTANAPLAMPYGKFSMFPYAVSAPAASVQQLLMMLGCGS